MRLFALPIVVFAAVSATSLNDLSVYDTTLAEAQTMTQIAPLAIYHAAKESLDNVCLIWENKDAIGVLAKKLVNIAKRVHNFIKGPEMKQAKKMWGAFVKHVAPLIVQILDKTQKDVVKKTKKAIKDVGSWTGLWAQKQAAQALAQSQANDGAFSRGEVILAQLKADEKDKLAFLFGLTGDQLKEGALLAVEAMLAVVEKSPWGEDLLNAKHVVKFIDDVSHNRRISLTQMMDTSCAINAYLPSAKALGKFMTKGATKGARKKMLKKAAKKFSQERMMEWAAEQAFKCRQQLLESAGKSVCHMENEENTVTAKHVWHKIEGYHFQNVSVANNGYVWGVNLANQIYFRNGVNNTKWHHVGGLLKQISVAGNSGNYVWGVTSSDQIYFRHGLHGHWTEVGGRLVDVAVCGNAGQQVWGVNRAQEIFQRDGFHGSWRHIGGKLRQISCGGDHGDHIWGVNVDQQIYYKHGVNDTWHWVHGNLKQVSVTGNAGQHVWGVNANNDIYYRNGFHAKGWTHIPGKLSQLSVGGSRGQYSWGGFNGNTYFSDFSQ